MIDIILEGRDALVVGGGKEPEFKVVKLLEAGARATVLAPRFSPGLRRLASENKQLVALVRSEESSARLRKAIEERGPRVVFISTGDAALDEELAETARSSGGRLIICVVDDPRLNDFNMPAIAKLGDVTVAVSTGGKSPAMAGLLKKKAAAAISPEDILQVKLQGEIREAAKKRLKDARSRKRFAYKVIRDGRIAALLRRNEYGAAKKLAQKMLREESEDG